MSNAVRQSAAVSGPRGRWSATALALALILGAQLVLGGLYAVRTPPWQAPDEPAHYNYVRIVAETTAFPVLEPGDYDQAYLEQLKSEKFPPELPIDSIRYEAHQPPLYYLLAAPFYLAARAAGLNPALVLRFLNVLLALVVTLLAYRVLGRVFPGRSLLALAGAGFIATVPMHLAMSAAVNNDLLAELVLAALLLVCVRRVQGALSSRRFLLLGGILYGAALLTKTTIYSSAVLLILAELGHRQIGAARAHASVAAGATLRPRRGALARAARLLAPLFALALALSGLWFARNLLTYGLADPFGWARHDAVVVGQPTTAEAIASDGLRNVVFDFVAISFKSFWAQFGWMGVLVNDRIYVLLGALTAVAGLGAGLWLLRPWRSRAQRSPEQRWSWLILSALLALVAAAHVYYNLKFVQPQGRYLFPALIPLSAFWVAGLDELSNARHARLLFGLLYVLMLALDYVALAWFIVPQLAR